MATTPEGKIKKKVNAALRQLGADVYRFMPVQSGFGMQTLDYLLSVRGRFVAIETKAPGKKLTPLQEGTKAAIEAAGGIVLVVYDEPTLAIAMNILLAIEFAPPPPQGKTYEINRDCLNIALGPNRNPGEIKVKTINPSEDWRYEKQWTSAYDAAHSAATRIPKHLRAKQPAQAADATIGRDHGAPGEEPE